MPELTLCIGATGAQGGSVARRLLQSGRAVRALTRNPDSASARELRDAGAELVQGDLSDLSKLTAAMDGCESVFGVTNYWEHFGCEVAHGKNLVDATRAARVPHLVLSTLPSAELLSRGAISVPHCDSKAAIETYAWRTGVSLTCVHVAFYFENFLSWFVPRADETGALTFGFPQGSTKLAGVAIDDLGAVVECILAEPARFRGATIGVVGDELRCDDYAAVLSEVLGRQVRYQHVDRAEYASLPFPGASDLAAMFDLNRRFIETRAEDIALTRTLHPDVRSFAQWAAGARDRLLAACDA